MVKIKFIKNSKKERSINGYKTLKFAQKRPSEQRSSGIGAYPIPTGRILQKYAYKHDLMPITKKVKGLLFTSDPDITIIGQDDVLKTTKKKSKDLTYHEAIRRYPHMNPLKDSDKDGVINLFDCRPFNKKKQDEEFNKYDEDESAEIASGWKDVEQSKKFRDSEVFYGENWRKQMIPSQDFKRMKIKPSGMEVEVKSKNIEIEKILEKKHKNGK